MKKDIPSLNSNITMCAVCQSNSGCGYPRRDKPYPWTGQACACRFVAPLLSVLSIAGPKIAMTHSAR